VNAKRGKNGRERASTTTCCIGVIVSKGGGGAEGGKGSGYSVTGGI